MAKNARKRKVLEISDIQDEEDIYDSLVIKQNQRDKLDSNTNSQKLAPKLTFEDDDYELFEPVKLNEKVEQMNVKFISKSKRRNPKVSTPPVNEYSQFALQEEDEIKTVAKMIVENFESLRLYENLGVEPASFKVVQFRLFVYSILYNQMRFFAIDDADKAKFIEIFNVLSQVREFDHNYEDKFVRGGHSGNSQPVKVDDDAIQKAIEAGIPIINRTVETLKTKISKGILKSLGIEPAIN